MRSPRSLGAQRRLQRKTSKRSSAQRISFDLVLGQRSDPCRQIGVAESNAESLQHESEFLECDAEPPAHGVGDADVLKTANKINHYIKRKQSKSRDEDGDDDGSNAYMYDDLEAGLRH